MTFDTLHKILKDMGITSSKRFSSEKCEIRLQITGNQNDIFVVEDNEESAIYTTMSFVKNTFPIQWDNSFNRIKSVRNLVKDLS